MLMEISPHFWEHETSLDARSDRATNAYAKRMLESHLVVVSVFWREKVLEPSLLLSSVFR